MSKVRSAPEYIFVAKAGKNGESNVKKVLKPVKFSTLKTSIQKVFKETDPVTSLKRENGTPITDIREISAGMKIIVSFDKMKFIVQKEEDEELSITASPPRSVHSPTTNKQAMDTLFGVPSVLNGPLSLRPQPAEVEKPQPKIEPPTPVKPQTEDIDYDYDYENDNENEESAKEVTQPPPAPLPEEDISYTDDEFEVEQTQAAVEEESEYEYEEETTPEVSESTLLAEEASISIAESEVSEDLERAGIDIINTCIDASEFGDSVADAFNKLMPQAQDLIAKLTKLEHEQKMRYMKEILAVMKADGMFGDRSVLINAESISQKARDYVAAHRVCRPAGSTHLMKTAITGPKGSGKSTFMGFVAEEIILSLIATDAWKHTFIFTANWDNLCTLLPDMTAFYKAFVKHTFALFEAQTPTMLQYLPQIQTAFSNIVDYPKKPKSVVLPRKMVQDLSLKEITAEVDDIAMKLIDIWFNPEALSEWLTAVFTLPMHLAKAFGFTDTICLFDNMDTTGIDLFAVYPFDEASTLVLVSEYVKFAMMHCSFVISCHDTAALNGVLEPVLEGGLDLTSEIDILSVLDVVTEPEYKNYDVVIDFGDGRAQLRIDSDFCGGITSYLAKWNELNKCITALESADQEDDSYEEALYDVIAAAETLLLTIMSDEEEGDDFHIVIEKVKRYEKKNTSKRTTKRTA